MSAIIKCCWLCKHLHYESGVEGESGYSEYTPGGPGIEPVLKCRLDHFEVDFFSDSESLVRRKILSAETCEDFEDRGR